MVTRDTVCEGFFERFAAVFIDGLILLIPNVILVYAIGGVIGLLLYAVLNIGYPIFFWSTSGSTPGKSAMGLRVVSADGGGILSPGTAILRYFATYLSSIVILLGYLWALWDPKHETWHDKIAGTKVIRYK